MEKKLKHQQVVELYLNLSKVKGVEGRELTYAIKKNLKKLQPEIEVYQDEEKEVRKLLEDFDKEREKLNVKYATVDGKVKRKGSGYDISAEKMKDLEAEILALADTDPHKEVIKNFEEKWAELMKFRKEKESEFAPLYVTMEDIPKNISDENMNLIFELIE